MFLHALTLPYRCCEACAIQAHGGTCAEQFQPCTSHECDRRAHNGRDKVADVAGGHGASQHGCGLDRCVIACYSPREVC
jgi:hypothetical protein